MQLSRKNLLKNKKNMTFFEIMFRRLLKNKAAVFGLSILFIICLLAIFSKIILPYDPLDFNIRDRLQPPNSKHLFGTDNYGRDVFTRVIFGARISLTVSICVVIFATFFGTMIGVLAGYFSKLDNLLMRLMDSLMAFPSILLGIAIVTILEPSALNASIALGFVQIPRMARVVRGAVLQIKNCEYVTAAEALGSSNICILLSHIIPNCMAPIIVQSSFIFAYAVLGEAALSFIGAGTPPPAPSWGNILSEGREFMRIAPWITIAPGLFIATTVFGLNMSGDGLRDVLDPRIQDNL